MMRIGLPNVLTYSSTVRNMKRRLSDCLFSTDYLYLSVTSNYKLNLGISAALPTQNGQSSKRVKRNKEENDYGEYKDFIEDIKKMDNAFKGSKTFEIEMDRVRKEEDKKKLFNRTYINLNASLERTLDSKRVS